MVKFLIDRPVAVIMSFLAFVILGVVTYFSIPVSLLPDIDIPRITVRVVGEDMSARELENTATSHVRRQLQQVAGVSEIRSVTRDGSAVIYMDFDYGVDMDLAFIAANEKVDAAMNSLPRGMQRPKVIKSNVTDIPAMYMNLTLKNEDADNEEEFLQMAWTADNTLRRILEQLPEVAMVDMSGVPELTLSINPDRDRMKSAGITDADISALLQRSNSTPGSMTVRDGYYEYNVSVSNSLASVSDVAALQLSHTGRLIRLGDIADIRLTQKSPAGLATYNGRRAVSLAVVKQNEEHIDGLRRALSRVAEEFSDKFPDYELSVSRDQTQLLDSTMSSLIQNLALGLILVFIVTAVFLGDLKTPFVIGISILTALALTALTFYLFGISLNVVSVSGLILAVGMMIDNSVIVTENITQYRAKGLDLRNACAEGTSEMITPLLSSALTTVAVFVPLIFMSGIAGAIFADQAFSITAGLAMSYVTGIALLPVLYRLFFTNRKGSERQLKQTIRLDGILNRLYDRISASMFRHKWIWLTAAILTVPAGVLMFFSLKTEKTPDIEHSETMARIEWNEPLDVKENARRTAAISTSAQSAGCLERSAAIGVQDYLLDNGGNLAGDEAELYLRADSPESIQAVRDSLKHAVAADYPKAAVSFYAPDNIFEKIFTSTEPDLEVRIFPKERQSVPSPRDFRPVRDAVAGKAGVPASEPATRTQTDIIPDRDRIALYNVDPSEVNQVLASAFRNKEISTLRTTERHIPITLQASGNSLTSTLNSTFVKSRVPQSNGGRPEGGLIPVSRLVTLGESTDFKEITAGKNGEYLSLGYVGVADPAVTAREIANALRNGTDWDSELGGAWFASREIIAEMIVILLVSLVMMYFILCAQFESFTQPLIVLFEIPVDTAFALLALRLTGNSLNIMSAIGIVVTCGIVVNDSILKLDTINTLRRKGMPLLKAIHTAGLRRIRPILMTSLTTIIAMVPVLFTDDLGSMLQRPLAIAMIGSMTVGTLVSIFTIPIIYYILYHRRDNAVTAANTKNNNEQDQD